MAIGRSDVVPPDSPRHGVENIVENGEGVMDELDPFLPDAEEGELERVQSWSQKSLGPGFIWIQTGRYLLSVTDITPIGNIHFSMNRSDPEK
jgi:hypothetical protein